MFRVAFVFVALLICWWFGFIGLIVGFVTVCLLLLVVRVLVRFVGLMNLVVFVLRSIVYI